MAIETEEVSEEASKWHIPAPGKELGQLSNTDAQLEANMLRETAQFGPLEKAPSKEEYERALTEIEALIDSARNETNPNRIKLALQRSILLTLESLLVGADVILNGEGVDRTLPGDIADELGEKRENLRSYSQRLRALKKSVEGFKKTPKE